MLESIQNRPLIQGQIIIKLSDKTEYFVNRWYRGKLHYYEFVNKSGRIFHKSPSEVKELIKNKIIEIK